MTIELDGPTEHGMYAFLHVVFLRMVAAFLMLSAISYWALIVGASSSPDIRFDTMPEYWRFTSLTLSVILPVAALGLWGLFPWGAFLWLMVILMEFAMYYWFSELFGENQTLLIFHTACFSLYLLFILIRMFIIRSQRQ